MSRHPLKLLFLAIVLILAGLYPAKTKLLFDELASKVSPASNPATTPAASPAENPSQPGAPPASGPLAQIQSVVEAYMRKYTSPQNTLSFLSWSDFATSGQTSAITLRYQVRKPVGDDVFAAVRFTVQAGSVIQSEIIQTGLQSAIIPPVQPARLPGVHWAQLPTGRAAQVIDRFSGPRFAALHGPSMALELSDAFSLAQLDQAKAKAQAQRKPLGFLMVWGQFFDRDVPPQGRSGNAALVHFYEAFNDQLVLVFVRHETELGMVPPAVAKGFGGPDEGGYAPNMAVTDASATEFILEIPSKDLDAAGRDPLFADGGHKIDEWLSTHPDAMPTPAAANP